MSSALSERQARRVQETRDRIINAMRDYLAQSESLDITVDELCERADVARKTFYNHFHGINQVQMELVAEFVQEDYEVREIAHNAATGFSDRFIGYVLGVIEKQPIDVGLYHRNIFKAGLHAYFQQEPESAAILQMLRQNFFVDWLQEAEIKEGFISPIPQPAFVEFYFGMQNGTTVKTAFDPAHSFRGDIINANDLLLRYFLRNIEENAS